MKARTFVILLLLVTTIVAGMAAAVLYSRGLEAQRAAQIAQANMDALRDTVTMYEDSLSTTVSLMQTQGQVSEDSIAELLGTLGVAIEERNQTLVALNSLRVTFRTLREEFESVTVTQPPEEDTPGSEQATFEITGPPIDGNLWVTYRPNAPWSLRTALTPTPFDLVYSIGCDEMNRALVNITTPPWVPVTPERGTISPDLCNPLKPLPIFSFSMGRAVWALGGAGVGAFVYWLFNDGPLDREEY
jgi:hypothetical protein